MRHSSRLTLDEPERNKLWRHVIDTIEDYAKNVSTARVAPVLDVEKIRASLKSLDFNSALDPMEAVNFVVQGLWRQQVHTPHPRYFGLFNPAPTTLGIAADALVAAFNPQLAA